MSGTGAVFHEGHDDLHGFTVVIEAGSVTWVGRWDSEADGRIRMVGVVRHQDGEDGLTTQEFIERIARTGFQEALPQAVVERGGVVRVRKLGDVTREVRGF